MANTTTLYTVKIDGCTTRVRVRNDAKNGWGAPVSADEAADLAFEKAIAKLYGASASWWADSGVSGMGQVTRPCATGGNTCITGRIGYVVRAEREFPVDQVGRDAVYAGIQADIDQDRVDEERGFEDGRMGRQMEKNYPYYYGVGYSAGRTYWIEMQTEAERENASR